MYVFVAGSASSGPARTSRDSSEAWFTGEPATLVTASVRPPRALAISVYATRSGEPPDCETVTQSTSRRSGSAR